MLAELLAHECVDELCTLRSRFGVMAYHGGNLERATDVVASLVAERTGSSFYGIVQQAPLRRHVASTRLDRRDSPRLDAFLDHVEIVLTIHGYGRRRLRHHLLLGGQNRGLARHLAVGLRQDLRARYRVVDELNAIPKELQGQHPRNPVNLPRLAGAQLELPPSIRWNWREWGWAGFRGVSRTHDLNALIESLSHSIEGWNARAADPTSAMHPAD